MRMRVRRPATYAAVIGLLAILSVACAGERRAPVDFGGELPPMEAAKIEPLYEKDLAALDLRFAPRGGLIDTGRNYEPSPTGTHLALYLEPTRPYSAADYVDGIVSAARVFVPGIFERWTGLESFDVCQEPAQRDPSEEPEPATQIRLTREQAAAIDWKSVTASDLIAASRAKPPEIGLTVAPFITRDRAYRRAAAKRLWDLEHER